MRKLQTADLQITVLHSVQFYLKVSHVSFYLFLSKYVKITVTFIQLIKDLSFGSLPMVLEKNNCLYIGD